MPTSRLRACIPSIVLLAVLCIPLVAGAQTPLPGEQPEPAREWTWYLSWPILAGTFGLVLLVLASYLRLSTRFYGKEEAPKQRPQPQYAGVNAPAYPAPAVQQQASAAQQPAPAAAPAQQEAPPAPPEPAEEVPKEEPPKEEPPKEEAPKEEAPKEEAQAQGAPTEEPEEKPAEEAPKEEAQPQQAAAGGDDVYERVLKEQLDKGVSPKVAEGRAKAAALKAKRQQGGE